ncbi:MAG TPA: flagellar export chaperone FlgN [Tepidisphaeraceae bacterium]|nr:flagellar export chaperone FlgN [Tepidisphaeraceae bacterium]
MSRQLAELENILTALIAEHKKLLAETERHQAAIQAMNVAAMDASRSVQETMRARIASLDGRRKILADQLGAPHKVAAPTLTRLAELYPQSRKRLLEQRDELRRVIGEIQQRTQVAGRVAGAMLGHLNSVVRILGTAMRQAGVYTKKGLPRLAPRIGAIEAVA